MGGKKSSAPAAPAAVTTPVTPKGTEPIERTTPAEQERVDTAQSPQLLSGATTPESEEELKKKQTGLLTG